MHARGLSRTITLEGGLVPSDHVAGHAHIRIGGNIALLLVESVLAAEPLQLFAGVLLACLGGVWKSQSQSCSEWQSAP